jgi:very-short-patch-repair endonuclease
MMLRRVPRRPVIPEQLTHGPFSVAEARRAGLARWHLEGASWRRLGPATYAWSGLSETPSLKLDAARRRLPLNAVFSGKSAAWLHGLDVAPCEPIDVILPGDGEGWERGGVSVRRATLDDLEVVVRHGFRTTSLHRTLSDLSRKLSLVEAVVIADMALHAGLIQRFDLSEWVDRRSGRKGVGRERLVLQLAETGAESPMESRLRLLLVLNGLPRPEVQVTIRDEVGSFVGRPDLYYRDQRLGIEYDGETHRTSLVEDNRRQNRLLLAEVTLLRFTAADVLRRPNRVVEQVRNALRQSRPKPAFTSPMRASLRNETRIPQSDAVSERSKRVDGRGDSN